MEFLNFRHPGIVRHSLDRRAGPLLIPISRKVPGERSGHANHPHNADESTHRDAIGKVPHQQSQRRKLARRRDYDTQPHEPPWNESVQTRRYGDSRNKQAQRSHKSRPSTFKTHRW